MCFFSGVGSGLGVVFGGDLALMLTGLDRVGDVFDVDGGDVFCCLSEVLRLRCRRLDFLVLS